MKLQITTAATWSRLTAFLALTGALAGCGGGGYGGSGNPSPTLSIDAQPTTITLGQSATLTWASNAGTSCDASGAWEGAEPAAGTAEVTPTETGVVTYTLSCSGGSYDGSAVQSVMLTVEKASTFTMTALVEDLDGGAAMTTDAHLVNPWGMAFAPTSAFWVADNGSDTLTIYDGSGRASTLVLSFAVGSGGASFAPTGMVFNDAAGFLVTGGDAGRTGQSVFLFAGEGGMVAGWSPDVDRDPVTVYTAQDGAVYKGLALADNGSGDFLYATDFANGKVDVFDTRFARQTPTETSFAFSDPTLPDGYAPFGIRALDTGAGGATQIYVSYARRDPDEPDDDMAGPGLGIVDTFDTNGKLLEHLVVEGGKLNAPWGLALAPSDFGTLSDALLVGNFGDGTIRGYDPATGRYLGAVTDITGAPFAVPGLWAITFGNDAVNQPHATLFFTAGTNDEEDGLYGRVDLGDGAPALGTPPVVTLTVPEGELSGTVTLTAAVEDTLAIDSVRFVANGDTLIGTATGTPSTVQWDTTTVGSGSVTLRAIATDDNGNVGSSALQPVVVANADAP